MDVEACIREIVAEAEKQGSLFGRGMIRAAEIIRRHASVEPAPSQAEALPVTEEWLRSLFDKPNAKPNPMQVTAVLDGVGRWDDEAFWYLEFSAEKGKWRVSLSRQETAGRHLGTWFCADVSTRADVLALLAALKIPTRRLTTSAP